MVYRPHLFPVSVKGVVIRDGAVLLLRNERDEWELPGGKLELGEDPTQCLTREIAEEVGWQVTPTTLLSSWQYHIADDVDVLIVTYGCSTTETVDPVVSHEHQDIGLFTQSETATLRLPDRYRRDIATWFEAQRTAPDLGRLWQSARLWQQISTLATFVAACTDDEERSREARTLVRRAFATGPDDLDTLEHLAGVVSDWADELADHPHHPGTPRPREADMQARDYVKDLYSDGMNSDLRRWMIDAAFSAPFRFRDAVRHASSDADREDAAYVFGRVTMALDLGHEQAAERELKRLEELHKRRR